MSHYSFLFRRGLPVAAFLGITSGVSALDIVGTRDVAAGQQAFLRDGTAQIQFDWQALSGAVYVIGSLGSVSSHLELIAEASDGSVNVIRGPKEPDPHPTPLNLANYVDAIGFSLKQDERIVALADLAINGSESFDLRFENPQRSVGFALISGKTNATKTVVDAMGASFVFTALNEPEVPVGSAELPMHPLDCSLLMNGDTCDSVMWVTITSIHPFTILQVRETAQVDTMDTTSDQYFGNILSSVDFIRMGQRPGDCDGDGVVGMPDAICLLNLLFFEAEPQTTGLCNNALLLSGPLMDWHGDGRVDISDVIYSRA